MSSGSRDQNASIGSRTGRRRLLTLGLAGALVAGTGSVAISGAALGSAVDETGTGRVGEIRHVTAATAVPDSYIVVLKDSAVGGRAGTRQAAVATRAAALTSRYGGEIGHVYGTALNGFEARLAEPAARRLAADPTVAFVERNTVLRAEPIDPAVRTAGVQPNPPSWGLDRIDQPYLPLNQQYIYANTAPTVRVYVIDTGIRHTHVDFNGAVLPGVDFADGTLPADDCQGHGTALAGIVGGQAHGVAKDAQLVPVRVLGCNATGTIAQVIAGINWVTANHPTGVKGVADVGVGGGPSAALDNAITNSINSGIAYVVTSGSSAANACNYSPSRVPAAVTVAGTTSTDAKMSSANFGTCLDIFAPGQTITTTGIASNVSTITLSSSSMASAHVAGCLAVTAQANPAWTLAQVTNYVLATATTGVVTNPGVGSPNRLLYCGP